MYFFTMSTKSRLLGRNSFTILSRNFIPIGSSPIAFRCMRILNTSQPDEILSRSLSEIRSPQTLIRLCRFTELSSLLRLFRSILNGLMEAMTAFLAEGLLFLSVFFKDKFGMKTCAGSAVFSVFLIALRSSLFWNLYIFCMFTTGESPRVWNSVLWCSTNECAGNI